MDGKAMFYRITILSLILGLFVGAVPKAGGMAWYALGSRDKSMGPHSVEVMTGLTYAKAGQKNLLADIYRPCDSQGPFPGIVLVHGGGWRYFNRQSVKGFAKILASQGFVVAAVDYRLSNEDVWPACFHDVKTAVRWLRANAKRYNVNPAKIGAVGDSAGGHLVAMLGAAGPDAGLDGAGGYPETSSAIQAVVAYYGLFDLSAMTPPVTKDAGPIRQLIGATFAQRPDLYKQASPITHLDKNDPPFMLVHGRKDHIVPVEQTIAMAQALQAAGVPARTILVDNADHMLLRWQGAKLNPPLEEIDRQVIEFLRENLGN